MPMSGPNVALRIKLDYTVFQNLLDKLCDMLSIEGAVGKSIDDIKAAKRKKEEEEKEKEKAKKNKGVLEQGLTDAEKRKQEQALALLSSSGHKSRLAAQAAAAAANEALRKAKEERARCGTVCPICGHECCGCKFHTYKPLGWADQDGSDSGSGTGPGEGGEDNNNGGTGGGDGGDDGSGGTGGDGDDDNNNNKVLGADVDQLIKDTEAAGKKFMLKMANEFDIEFQTMSTLIPCRNVFLPIVAGTLKFEFNPSMPILNPLELAIKVTLYFSLTILPILGTPCVGNLVVLVINTAYTILAPMAIELLQISLGGNDKDFVQSCTCVIKWVTTIKWTCTELVPPYMTPVPVITSIV